MAFQKRRQFGIWDVFHKDETYTCTLGMYFIRRLPTQGLLTLKAESWPCSSQGSNGLPKNLAYTLETTNQATNYKAMIDEGLLKMQI